MQTNAMAGTGCCQWGVESDIHITFILWHPSITKNEGCILDNKKGVFLV